MTLETPKADIANAPRAGRSDRFPSGTVTYLSPLPLPTGLPAVDHSQIVTEVRDEYLELGAFTPNVFSWQVTVGIPMGMFVLTCVVFPITIFLGGLVWGEGLTDAITTSLEAVIFSIPYGLGITLAILLITLFPRFQAYFKLRGVVPTRFNRQRREVCLVPSDSDTPVFVPWEDIQAWVVQAQGATQYGVQRQYGFGFGGVDPNTGMGTSLELMSGGQPLAISTWEALRAYMEYEVNALEEIQEPQDLQKPGAPPLGRCAGQNHLTEWEVRKVQRLNRRATPESVLHWSEPLPEAEWSKPSETFKRLSQKVREKQQACPGRLPYEVFEEVYAEEDRLPLASNI
ncbi:hypothetical protein QPM17_04115 [Marinobacter sp. TBZ242]|uniref:Uncharacterized protein n=1 Tax=Marinobacter azerbaijanicus TaxID=3050455 RepID=A0ABT7I890_9GAMM|nr:DUF6708 domain-containing protein [Marinobacter sp. TBZ242]MDL0430295.1 hypothetical protein [Marinobacter sp. TBZ242]